MRQSTCQESGAMQAGKRKKTTSIKNVDGRWGLLGQPSSAGQTTPKLLVTQAEQGQTHGVCISPDRVEEDPRLRKRISWKWNTKRKLGVQWRETPAQILQVIQMWGKNLTREFTSVNTSTCSKGETENRARENVKKKSKVCKMKWSKGVE